MRAQLFRTYVALLVVAVPLACDITSPALGVPASPHIVTVTQPDGSRIALNIRGDEFFSWYEDLNSFTVVQRVDNTYVYAKLGQQNDLEPTALVVGRDDPAVAGLSKKILPPHTWYELRRQRMFVAPANAAPDRTTAPTGTVKNIVILLRFANHIGRTLPAVTDLDKIFNAVGGDPGLAPSGSVRDVYFTNSYGALVLQSTVFAWVTLPHTEQYYADGNSGSGTKVHEAIRDALVLADASVDFSQFDRDGDGFVDAIAFIHSGYGAEWGGVDEDGTNYLDRIWSHRWSIPTWTSAEGIKVSPYHISPSLWSTSGSAPGRIGVISHETGHFFGLPDLYDGLGGGEGIGSWCMMANSWGFDGSQHYPPHFCAWCKIRLAWSTPTVISSPGTYVAPQSETNNAMFKISAGYPADEYLLIENRQPTNFDQKIPVGTGGTRGGLAIWHVDDKKAGNTQPGWPGQAGWPGNNMHYRVALLQADGRYDLEHGRNRGDGDDVFRKGFSDQISSTTVPDLNAYQNGVVIEINDGIFEIGASGPTMSFRYGKVPPPACCLGVHGEFRSSDNVVVSTGTIVLPVTIHLDQDMEVHVEASTSGTTNDVPVTVITGFSDSSDPSLMWDTSTRVVNLAVPTHWVNVGSTFATILPRGDHTIYWKMSASGGDVRLGSGVMLVQGFAVQRPLDSLIKPVRDGQRTVSDMKPPDLQALDQSTTYISREAKYAAASAFEMVLGTDKYGKATVRVQSSRSK